METIFRQILEIAVNAPSGDNSQPWQFAENGPDVELINLPDRDNPVFNYKQRGSYIAHGAVLENISQLAPVYGYQAQIMLFPEGHGSQLVARISLTAGPQSADKSIIDIIKQRCTNRKKYKNNPLPAAIKTLLFSPANGPKLLLAETAETKALLGQAASSAEKTMLQYQPLHNAFFSMIRWDQKEENEKKGGLLIGTLELLPPQKLIFKWFSHWKAAGILRTLGFPKLIAKENSKTYACSAAIGAIITKDAEPESFIQTGQTLQKIWLEATRAGLSLQPIAGILYLHQRLQDGALENIPKNLEADIYKSVKSIYQGFNNPQGFITMMFRLGQTDAPSARSSKFMPTFKQT